MLSWYEIPALILVAALWGCTNPFLRKGSTAADNDQGSQDESRGNKSSTSLVSLLKKFKNVQVWLPFVVNQSGSVLFYILLSKSDLSVAVPTCNALALIFSICTSFILGEKVNKPVHTVVGAILVMSGVTICLESRSKEST